MEIKIREIQPNDNAVLASIIRNSLEEFGANKPGTVYFDQSTDHLYDLFQTNGSCYYVVTQNNIVLGGGGIFPSEGLPADTCELVKMYLTPEARGLGIGATLIQQCMDKAKENGYSTIYIETMPELKKAIQVYEQFGFEYLKHAVGNTGHCGCNVWMIKSL